jgi:hypothetical protein
MDRSAAIQAGFGLGELGERGRARLIGGRQELEQLGALLLRHRPSGRLKLRYEVVQEFGQARPGAYRRADDANDGPGVLWTDLDYAAVQQQVRGRVWTAVDTPDLARDQSA